MSTETNLEKVAIEIFAKVVLECCPFECAIRIVECIHFLPSLSTIRCHLYCKIIGSNILAIAQTQLEA